MVPDKPVSRLGIALPELFNEPRVEARSGAGRRPLRGDWKFLLHLRHSGHWKCVSSLTAPPHLAGRGREPMAAARSQHGDPSTLKYAAEKRLCQSARCRFSATGQSRLSEPVRAVAVARGGYRRYHWLDRAPVGACPSASEPVL